MEILLKVWIGSLILFAVVGITGITLDWWFDKLIDFLGLGKLADKLEMKLAKRYNDDYLDKTSDDVLDYLDFHW